MRTRNIVVFITLFFTLLLIFTSLRYRLTTQEAIADSQSKDTETIISKLDSLLAGQAQITTRLEEVEREVKNRCK